MLLIGTGFIDPCQQNITLSFHLSDCLVSAQWIKIKAEDALLVQNIC